jgi:NAD(P)H-dependent flavin oxidoreductase YrpB (nitropropane dioxygenase family)
MKEIKIGNKILKWPIIQGGMGVGVSLGNLAGNVALEGGMGTISAAHPGYKNKNFDNDVKKCNIQGLKDEIQKAKDIAQNKGLIAVNIMVAMNGYQDFIIAAVESRVDAIISGAGLPLDLPKYADKGILIAPIVSSRKALELINRRWKRVYDRLPDFIVIEGPEAGGHLGFGKEDLINSTTQTLEDILADVKKYLIENDLNIPTFVAGGIYDNDDIKHFLNLGADGVQMGTRFVTTFECDADISFKQAYMDSTKEDIIFVKSPTGFTGRGIKNKYMEKIMQSDNMAVDKCYGCLKKCNPADTPYCISTALINAVKGKEESLIFCGSNAYKTDKLVSVKDLMKELIGE